MNYYAAYANLKSTTRPSGHMPNDSAQETSMYPVGGQQGSPVSPVQQSPQQGYGQSAYNQQPPMVCFLTPTARIALRSNN